MDFGIAYPHKFQTQQLCFLLMCIVHVSICSSLHTINLNSFYMPSFNAFLFSILPLTYRYFLLLVSFF